MTTTAPVLTSRVVGLAHYAARGVLEKVLARHGLTFQQSLALRAVAGADEPLDREALVDQVVDSLKAEKAEIRVMVEESVAAGLLEADPARPSRLRITDAGQEAHSRSVAETAPISARIYADIPAEELAAAGRTLTLITERANAELAAMK
ncbi:winged helix DNA-binding protein [Streptomyces scabiei]|uniref:winged helix DNA-binding protein n=1 Tax=Streptomyces TaxID=1883 RepID=UPI001BFF6BA0|nr:winged helix DNA-binding protein [Streptomyces sp. ATCC 21386]